jgi:biopolymer transport protein ExbB
MKTPKNRKLSSLFTLILLAVCAQWLFSSSAHAQDEAVAEAENAEVILEVDEGSKSVLDMFNAGGWAMYPLGLLSISGFGLIIYNFMAVKPGPILAKEALDQVDTALGNLDIEKAKSICEENPAPATNIVAAGLARVDVNDFNPEQVKEAVEEASAEELSGPFILINYLSVIGSLSPMVGLLGTVSGMVKAFNVIEAEGAGSAQALAGNISEALITTATGMIIGIPAMFFFFFFKNRYGKITSRIGRMVGDLQFTLNKAIKQK